MYALFSRYKGDSKYNYNGVMTAEEYERMVKHPKDFESFQLYPAVSKEVVGDFEDIVWDIGHTTVVYDRERECYINS